MNTAEKITLSLLVISLVVFQLGKWGVKGSKDTSARRSCANWGVAGIASACLLSVVFVIELIWSL